jgi:glycosyltransferase involved in cell wall biosynthesis
MNIAVLWARLGPYHLARLRGAAAAVAATDSEARVFGLEVAGSDSIYDWDPVAGDASFERVTLFPDRDYESLSEREISGAVRAALDRICPDAIAVNGWAAREAQAAMDWRRRQTGTCVVLMSETKRDDAPRAWWKELVKSRIVRRADAALVGGRAQAAYLRRLGFPNRRIFIGYDAVDNDYFRKGADAAKAQAAKLRSERGLPERFYFACTRFIERKNIDGLLHAYAGYRSACNHTPWGLVIAGGGEEKANLIDLQTRLGLEGVVWPGFVQYGELPIYYGLASAFVHPAKSEPWGLVTNEAAASGLPLLLSRTVGAGLELLSPGDNGFDFDPLRTEDMRSALLRLSQSPDATLERMGRRSSEIVRDWGPERFGTQLMAAIGSTREAGTAWRGSGPAYRSRADTTFITNASGNGR